MDRPINKVDYVTTSKLNEISEQIKKSIALLTQIATPFQLSSPVEPLQKITVEDNAIEEFREKLSSLNIQGSEYESTTQLDCPVNTFDEIESNDGSNANIQNTSVRLDSSVGSTIPSIGSIKSFDEVTSSDSVRLDDTVPWIRCGKSFSEVGSNEASRLNNSEESTVPWISSKKSSDAVTSCDDLRLDNGCKQDDEAYGTSNIQMSSFHVKSEEFVFDASDIIQALNVELDGSTEQGADKNESSNEVDYNKACNVHKENIQGLSLPTDCNEEQDIEVDCNKEQDIQADCNKEQDIEVDCNKEQDIQGDCNEEQDIEEDCNKEQDIQSLHLPMDSNEEQDIQLNYNGEQDIQVDYKKEQNFRINCNEKQDIQVDCNEEQNIKGNGNEEQDIRVDCNEEQSIQEGCNKEQDLQVNCNEEQDIQVNYNKAQDIQVDCNKEQKIQVSSDKEQDMQMDCNENIASNDISGNIQTCSATVSCCVPQVVDSDKLLKDVNENIPAPSIEISYPEPQDVDNTTPKDNTDNCRAVTCKSGEIAPDTQITHLEVDSHIRPPQRLYDHQPLPFLIKHVHKITWPNQEEVAFSPVLQLFGQTFSTVMIYGVVTSLTVEQGGLTQRFVIDDGSGSIHVMWKANKQILDLLKTIHHLDEEVKQCRQAGLSVMNENWQPNSEECKKMLDSFDKILHYIKRQITERTKLKLFGYAGVVGKPYRCGRDKNIVKIHTTLIEDNSRDRSLELYFKKNLIRLYEEKYMSNR